MSTAIDHESAITDNSDKNSCIIDWEGANVIDRERNKNERWIKEAICKSSHELRRGEIQSESRMGLHACQTNGE